MEDDWLNVPETPRTNAFAGLDIHLKVVGRLKGLPWANLCLTKNGDLWLFAERADHKTVFEHHGIQWEDIIVSGHTHSDGRTLFHSSEAEDRSEISNEEAREFMRQIERLIKEEKIDW